MAKWCPLFNERVSYPVCQECDKKLCNRIVKEDESEKTVDAVDEESSFEENKFKGER